MTPLYGFGFAQEDDRTETRALCPARGRRLLCVASGGEVALGMAARGATVDAVDADPAQLHLVALKHATALTLEPEDATVFLGYAHGTAGRTSAPDRRTALFQAVRPRLTRGAAAFWDTHPQALRGGALWAGRFEQYLGRLMAVLRPAWGRRAIEALCACEDPSEQERIFDASIGGRWLRGVFHLAFHPAVYGRNGIAARALAQRAAPESLGEQYFRQFRAFCTRTPARDNWFLAVALRGGLADPERGPDYLRAPGMRLLREDPDRLRLHPGDLRLWLTTRGDTYDGFHLSNLGDWMDEAAFGSLLGAVVDHATPGATFVWRELQVERHAPRLLGNRLVLDRVHGELLRTTDRFPFYRVVPGRVIDA